MEQKQKIALTIAVAVFFLVAGAAVLGMEGAYYTSKVVTEAVYEVVPSRPLKIVGSWMLAVAFTIGVPSIAYALIMWDP